MLSLYEHLADSEQRAGLMSFNETSHIHRQTHIHTYSAWIPRVRLHHERKYDILHNETFCATQQSIIKSPPPKKESSSRRV